MIAWPLSHPLPPFFCSKIENWEITFDVEGLQIQYGAGKSWKATKNISK